MYQCIKSGVLGEERVGDGVVAQAAVFLVFGKIANTDLGEVARVALVDLLEGQIFLLHVVRAGLHVFAVVDRSSDDRTPLLHTKAELPGGRLVVRDQPALTDAGPVGNVKIDGAVIAGGEYRGNDARAK